MFRVSAVIIIILLTAYLFCDVCFSSRVGNWRIGSGNTDTNLGTPERFSDAVITPFSKCSDCETLQKPDGGYTVLNPYILPYSATTCMDSIYDPLIPAIQVQTLTTPDHVIQTN